ncbi:Unknown protein [Striga hermonthica]|uniref:Uncharacterized protein n=1 Tax=Striga hermonthica TaxID=68872 RepID=A0A9N7RG36_STRHE|nr:Unknown protein [Striga hermonthica]
MKRGLKWSDGEDGDTSSSGDSSAHDSDAEDGNGSSKTQSSKFKASQDYAKKKKGIDFEALSRHGYKGGLSVLKVPAPKEPEKEQNWSWSTGKDKQQQKGGEKEEEEESYEERMKTRAALASGERLLNVQTRSERSNANNLSFQQKEKRKRDLGQASRGKSYVEEEKRLLRESGIYSGFDS